MPSLTPRFSPRNVWAVEQALNDHRHWKLRTPNGVYEKWHARYIAWKAKHPSVRPTYYPNRHTWFTG